MFHWGLLICLFAATLFAMPPHKKCDEGQLAPHASPKVDITEASQELASAMGPFELDLALESCCGVRLNQIVAQGSTLQQATDVLRWVKDNKFTDAFLFQVRRQLPLRHDLQLNLRDYFQGPSTAPQVAVKPPVRPAVLAPDLAATTAKMAEGFGSDYDLENVLIYLDTRLDRIVGNGTILEKIAKVLDYVKAQKRGAEFVARVRQVLPRRGDIAETLETYFGLKVLAPQTPVVAEAPKPSAPGPVNSSLDRPATIAKLAEGFGSSGSLQELALFGLGVSLGNITSRGTTLEQLGKILDYVKSHGIEQKLVDYVRKERPGRPDIIAAVESHFGLNSEAPKVPVVAEVPRPPKSTPPSTSGTTGTNPIASVPKPRPPVVTDPVAPAPKVLTWDERLDASVKRISEGGHIGTYADVEAVGSVLPSTQKEFDDFLKANFGEATARRISGGVGFSEKNREQTAYSLLQYFSMNSRTSEALQLVELARGKAPAVEAPSTDPIVLAKQRAWEAQVDAVVARAAQGKFISQEAINVVLKAYDGTEAGLLRILTPVYGDEVAKQLVRNRASGNLTTQVFEMMQTIERQYGQGEEFLKSLRNQKPRG